MKLYLSSYRIPTPDELFALLGKSPIGSRVAIIPNAKDDVLPNERAVKLDEVIYDLAKFGFVTETIDLRDYEDGESVKDSLRGFDMVWVAGGNTFILRAEMRRSGFDQIISQLLADGLLYCGESAGAIVAGTSLKGVEMGDEPELADDIIWEGLGLVDKIIVPHADSTDYLEYINHMKKLYEGDDRVIYLNDDQALVINS